MTIIEVIRAVVTINNHYSVLCPLNGYYRNYHGVMSLWIWDFFIQAQACL
jgi:hypothetical protein